MLAATYGISGERVSQQLTDVAGKLVADYPDYRKARNEMQELVRAQKNVERFLQRKRTPPRKHRHVKKVAEELSQLGGILGGFFGLYSSFAEQCACYPYIFPTIFPRAAAGRSLHKRLRNLYCAPAT